MEQILTDFGSKPFKNLLNLRNLFDTKSSWIHMQSKRNVGNRKDNSFSINSLKIFKLNFKMLFSKLMQIFSLIRTWIDRKIEHFSFLVGFDLVEMISIYEIGFWKLRLCRLFQTQKSLHWIIWLSVMQT